MCLFLYRDKINYSFQTGIIIIIIITIIKIKLISLLS